VSALVVHGVPPDRVLSLGRDERVGLQAVAALGDASWLPATLAGTDRLVLVTPGASPPVPLRAAPPPTRPRPAAPPPRRPRPSAPAFRPDYR
jgi:hypothetical protein